MLLKPQYSRGCKSKPSVLVGLPKVDLAYKCISIIIIIIKQKKANLDPADQYFLSYSWCDKSQLKYFL